MKIAIIQFPGSNCETETLAMVRQAGMDAEEFLWNEDQYKLTTYDGYIIVGGFSYEDRSRSGVIASLDPVMQVIQLEAAKGKPVLGICNGAQILVESGLVPGLSKNRLGMALTMNRRIHAGHILGTGYYNAWVHTKLCAHPLESAFTRNLVPNAIFRVPVAHGEGRFVMEESLLTELNERQRTTFRYSDESGNINPNFPINPNGATDNLAAVTNGRGNVMAIMPHPERTQGGLPLFTSMRDYITEPTVVRPPPFRYTPPSFFLQKYAPEEHTEAYIVNLIITDNEANTVQQTLQAVGVHAHIKRSVHWEVASSQHVPPHQFREQILASEVLFNPKKEYLIDVSREKKEYTRHLLVRYTDDVFGQQACQTLRERYGLSDITHVRRGVLWHISIQRGNIDVIIEHILDTHILYNPFSQECFIYNM